MSLDLVEISAPIKQVYVHIAQDGWPGIEMKICAECGQPTEATFISGIVSKECCRTCYDKLLDLAVDKVCHPRGDKTPLQKQAVTTEEGEAAVKENVS